MDKEIIRPLAEDGRISTGSLAMRLKVAAPTLRERINHLEKDGLLDFPD